MLSSEWPTGQRRREANVVMSVHPSCTVAALPAPDPGFIHNNTAWMHHLSLSILTAMVLLAEVSGLEQSLAVAVLYYVAPDSGFTLDILQCASGDSTLHVKFRLQLHELADVFDFLLGSLVLDVSTIPTCHSGETMVNP